MKLAPGAWRYALPPLLAAPFALVISAGASALALAAGAGVLAFFRDPDRSPPPTGVLAPADGRVSVLRPEGDRVRLGVFMNVWNVHVTRAPFSGAVAELEHTPGAHRPAFSKDSDRNERVHVRFEPGAIGDGDAAADRAADTGDERDEPGSEERDGDGPEVTLIAGAFARRIHPYVEAGDDVARGERLGHIAFGSRVDVVFPPSVDREDLAVEVGDAVTAGETVLLESDDETPAWFDEGVDPETDDATAIEDDRADGGERSWT